jgi:DNA-binding transcriptional ArsR family regulator
MQERKASPKELAAHFGVPLANVAYHIGVLRKLKLIRLVSKTRRRGAIEHHYIVDHLADLHSEAWAQTPDLIKERVVAEWIKDVGAYVTQAAATGGFNRANAISTRSRLVLDEEAWDIVASKLEEVFDLADELAKASSERLKRANHEGEIRSGMVLLLFESTPGVPNADEARHAGPSEAPAHPARLPS